MARRDTRLESQGAEFLVLGQLLIEGIPAYKAYVNMPGYDVLALNPSAVPGCTARVSVKSRWRAKASGILIDNFASDFVVIVMLNKGTANALPVQYFVIPTDHLAKLKRSASPWGKLAFSSIPNLGDYADGWERIKAFLGIQTPTEARPA
jgi:hypothetical protein